GRRRRSPRGLRQRVARAGASAPPRAASIERRDERRLAPPPHRLRPELKGAAHASPASPHHRALGLRRPERHRRAHRRSARAAAEAEARHPRPVPDAQGTRGAEGGLTMAEHRFHTPEPAELAITVPSGEIEVETIDGDESTIELEGDEKLIELTEVRQEGRRLIVEAKGKKFGLTISIGDFSFGPS